MMATEEQLNELKEIAQLKMPDNASKLDKALLIAHYAHTAFSHNGDNQPNHSDPVTILKEAQAGSRFRCVEYSHLAAWLMVAYGIKARTINIMMKNVETMEYGASHVVVEFYEGKKHKWVMVDVQAGVAARHKGILQSALELRESLESAKIDDFEGNKYVEPEGMFGGNYKKWLRPYLYFLDRPNTLSYEYTDDTRPHLILIPAEDKPPKYFQRTHKLKLVIATPKNFYRISE